MAGVWVTMKFMARPIGALVGGVFKVKRDLDSDRERVIANLRAEIADFDRREDDLLARLADAETKLRVAEQALAECQRFIAGFIKTSPPRSRRPE
jgi:chromosome segregation ATPase